MVSNRLPVQIDSEGNATRTTGGLAAALEGIDTGQECVWVGWPGACEEELGDSATVCQRLAAVGAVPVSLSRDEMNGFYEGYANATLWPVLHYMVERAKFSGDWWHAYERVNRKYAEVILDLADDGDTVWIHDYHFFPLPAMLRGSGKGLRVGFFLHTPFCSSEIFRVLPCRVELLRGMLGADVIGFHTHNYLRHFRSAVLRVLGLETDPDGLWHDGREVKFGVHPIGHNHHGIESAIQTPEFAEAVDRNRANLAGRSLILNVERLDYSKGIPEKLAAMRDFLHRHVEMRERVFFVLIAVPSRKGVTEYDQLTEQVQREVGAINGEFGSVGHAPVMFLHRSFPMTELAALYALSDVCLVTPLRDGMNLVAKEFLDCQREELSPRAGVLVLSEFAGAAEELSHALQVNPYDVHDVSEAIARALQMPDEEKWQRVHAMRGRLTLQHSGAWADRILKDLAAVPARDERVVLLEMKPLARKLAEAAGARRKLGIFLDYDGTLRGFVDKPEDALPDAELPRLLQELGAHPAIELAVVSGRPPNFLQEHLGGLGISLVAEHGYRWLDHGAGEWELFNPHVNTDWKETVREYLDQASMITPGTHVEEKQSALVWHYRTAEPEFGQWRARQLLDELTAMCANMPVTVHHGKKIVEVSSLQVSKGAAVDSLIRRWGSEIVLVAGDDQTDETMISLDPAGIEFHTVKVGKSPSRAAYRTDITGLRVFLEDLRSAIQH